MGGLRTGPGQGRRPTEVVVFRPLGMVNWADKWYNTAADIAGPGG